MHTAVLFHQQPLPRWSQVNHRLKLVRQKETKATKNQKPKKTLSSPSQTHTKRKQVNNYKKKQNQNQTESNQKQEVGRPKDYRMLKKARVIATSEKEMQRKRDLPDTTEISTVIDQWSVRRYPRIIRLPFRPSLRNHLSPAFLCCCRCLQFLL